jgi:hypothetical protein
MRTGYHTYCSFAVGLAVSVNGVIRDRVGHHRGEANRLPVHTAERLHEP